MAGGAADRRAREAAAVGPHPGLLAGEDLEVRLADRDLEAGAGQLARDRQLGLERPGSAAAARGAGGGGRPSRGRGAAAAAREGQQRGEGAAAQDAEEGSASQARLS